MALSPVSIFDQTVIVVDNSAYRGGITDHKLTFELQAVLPVGKHNSAFIFITSLDVLRKKVIT